MSDIHQVFTPGNNARENFVQRPEQENRLREALLTPGVQIVVYGESGRGKSTIVENVIQTTHENDITFASQPESTFESIIEFTASKLNLAIGGVTERVERKGKSGLNIQIPLVGGIGYSGKDRGETREIQQHVSLNQVSLQKLAEGLGAAKTCLVIDDFHLLDAAEKSQIAAAMKVFKNVSSAYPELKLIVLGTANSPGELLECSPDMAGRIAEIEIPLMNEFQIGRILEKGENLLNIKFTDEVRESIADYSAGHPVACHALALNACMALDVAESDDETPVVGAKEFRLGKKRWIQSKAASLNASFDKALRSTPTAKYPHTEYILRALCRTDADGLTVQEVHDAILQTAPQYPKRGLRRRLLDLCEEAKGAPLKLIPQTDRFCFKDPLHRAYAKDYVERTGTLDSKDVGSTRESQATTWASSDESISPEGIDALIQETKHKSLNWDSCKGTARLWWEGFEKENEHNRRLVLRVLEELEHRNSSVQEFFLSHIYADTDNIQANLYYLDYFRIKRRNDAQRSIKRFQSDVESALTNGDNARVSELIDDVWESRDFDTDAKFDTLFWLSTQKAVEVSVAIDLLDRLASENVFDRRQKAMAYAQSGWVHFDRMKDFDELLQRSLLANGLDPSLQSAHVNLALAYVIHGKKTEAAQLYKGISLLDHADRFFEEARDDLQQAGSDGHLERDAVQEMLNVIDQAQAEQDGAGQPATAPESKSEGK